MKEPPCSRVFPCYRYPLCSRVLLGGAARGDGASLAVGRSGASYFHRRGRYSMFAPGQSKEAPNRIPGTGERRPLRIPFAAMLPPSRREAAGLAASLLPFRRGTPFTEPARPWPPVERPGRAAPKRATGPARATRSRTRGARQAAILEPAGRHRPTRKPNRNHQGETS